MGSEGKKISARYTVNLKQQSPMIHFQANDEEVVEGVCVRASEFKPKFDRYLNSLGNIKPEWRIGDTAALNYKVKICAKGTAETISKIHALYFGNMSSDPDFVKRKAVYYRDGLSLEIICFNKELMAVIQEHLGEFLDLTNFGTRQNKGFGGFSLENRSGRMTLAFLKANKKNFFYVQYPKMANTKDRLKNIDEMFDIVAAVYATMKGGINRSFQGTDKYIKGYIQRQYFIDNELKNVKSDKAFIKAKKFFPDNNGDKKYISKEYQFVRAILGIPEYYEFKDKVRKGKIAVSNPEIERYQSPITVKIVDEYIFFIIEDTFDQIKGAAFQFEKVSGKGAVGVKDKIKVPETFDVDTFIRGFLQYFKQNQRKLANVGYRGAANIKLIDGRETQ